MRHLYQSRIHRRVKVVFAEGGAVRQAQFRHQFGGGFRFFPKGGKQRGYLICSTRVRIFGVMA